MIRHWRGKDPQTRKRRRIIGMIMLAIGIVLLLYARQ